MPVFWRSRCLHDDRLWLRRGRVGAPRMPSAPRCRRQSGSYLRRNGATRRRFAMRIGIDARALSEPGGGEETYIRNVVRALAAVDTDNEYTLFLNPAAPPAPIAGTERMRRIEVWPRSRSVRLLATFSLALRRARIDVVQVQNTVPFLCPAPPVLNVHDISYERYPQFFLPAEA